MSEAWRVIQEGQRMYVDKEGVVSVDDKPYHAFSHETDDSPFDFDDWRSVGLSKDELELRIHPIDDSDIECGLLAPDGIFYQCKYHEHQLLAESVAHHLVHWIKEKEKNAYSPYARAEDDIVKAGWAVLKSGMGGKDRWWNWPDKWTQRQMDAVWDRHVATGDQMPFEWED